MAEDDRRSLETEFYYVVCPAGGSCPDLARVSHLIKDAKLKKVNAHLAAKKPELFFLQPMSNWHLYSQFRGWRECRRGHPVCVDVLGRSGVFVLLLACINIL